MRHAGKKRREKKLFYLCVEGECEARYFRRLKTLINASEATFEADFVIKVGRSLKSILKAYRPDAPVLVVWDREGTSASEEAAFQNKLKEIIRESKDYSVSPGYTHLSFELWILLHKSAVPTVNRKDDYRTLINQYYHQSFESMEQYKREANFERILDAMTLEDVRAAISRGMSIREEKQSTNATKKIFGKYVVYDDNPDISLHICIKLILDTCKVRIQ